LFGLPLGLFPCGTQCRHRELALAEKAKLVRVSLEHVDTGEQIFGALLSDDVHALSEDLAARL
jgi:hypothetical protein